MLEDTHKGRICFLNFWTLLPKLYIFEVVKFFSRPVVTQSTQFFSGSTYLKDPRFWWSIFPLTIRMSMVTRLFRVVIFNNSFFQRTPLVASSLSIQHASKTGSKCVWRIEKKASLRVFWGNVTLVETIFT